MPYHQPTLPHNTQAQPTTLTHELNTHNQEPNQKITAHKVTYTYLFKAALVSWQNQNLPPKKENPMPYHQPTLLPNTQTQPTTHTHHQTNHNQEPNH